jgi:phosphatidylglycerol lysyltransferase
VEFRSSLRWLPAAISLVLFVAAIAIVFREIERYHWQDVRGALQALSGGMALLCAGLTLLSYLALSLYDYLALEYVGARLPYRRVLFTSFLSYALSNNVGHAWLSGGSMRYRLYSEWGIPAVSIAKIVIFCTASYVLGALTVMVGGYLWATERHLTGGTLFSGTMQIAIVAGAILLAAWWAAVIFYRRPVTIRGFSLGVPSPLLALRQLLAALLDLLLASLVLFVPLAHFARVPFSDFVTMYIFAQLAGLVSMVPGGVGVFEGVFLFGASTYYPAPHVIAALIVYRVIYYVLPLLLAAVLLAVYELQARRLVTGPLVSGTLNAAKSAVPQVFALLLMLGGGVLLFSGATPGLEGRLKWLVYFVPLPVMEVSHMLGSVAGVALLFLSQAVHRRIDAAYFATIAVLVLGIVASLGKGLDYEEALILGTMLILFIPSRKLFYRKSALVQMELSPQWLVPAAIVVIGSVYLGFFSYKHVEYSSELWWQFALHGDASRFLRSLLAILVLVTAFTGYRLLTRPALTLTLPGPGDLDRAQHIVRQASVTDGYLALTGDKYLLWSQSGQSFLMFAATSQFWVAMGDPVGPAGERDELAWQFHALADRHNAKIAFYQVSAEQIPLYLDLGLGLLKLGNEAKVALPAFSLEGRKRATLRSTYNKAQRDGLSFELLEASGVDAILPELQIVSNRWLAQKNAAEKRFSLGFFDVHYLRRCTIALVRQDGRIVAFSNLWELDNKNELSMDLMRYTPDAGSGIMDYLLVSLMLWGREQGYRWFNLGMAPLSGLEQRPLAPVWHKVGNTIFRFGHEFYNFEGIYQYKNKFDPVWQPRYLAAPTGLSMAAALLSVTRLISGDLKGAFSK